MESKQTILQEENWQRTGDGFALYSQSLADILEGLGIHHTGLSTVNPADVQFYYDDWYLFSVSRGETVYGLLKMREQEHDFFPGFADRDDPGITVSFIPFDLSALLGISHEEETLRAFVNAFRRVTDLHGQHHHPVLQQYFSDPAANGSYLIADAYLTKLLSMAEGGILALPERMANAPKRVLSAIRRYNQQSGKTICDLSAGCLYISDPEHPTREERLCLLTVHTGNPSFHSFSAEVKFHADALISWQNRIPIAGPKIWYPAAVRADMQLEPDIWVRNAFFAPYYNEHSPLVREQQRLHPGQ